MTFDGKAFGKEIVDVVKGFISDELKPIVKRLDGLEQQLNNLPTPKDGKDADMDEVRSIIKDELKSITEAVNAIQPAPELPDIPKMIDDAIAARIDVEDMERSIEEVVRSVVTEIPAPKDGTDGTSVTVDDVMPALQKQVSEYLSAIPAPQDGKSVTIEDVTPLIMSEIERRVSEIPKPKDGKDGRDGLDVKDLFRGEGGVLIATMSDGRIKELGQFVGKDGENGQPGQDGKDGIGFDDLDLVEDEAGLSLKFTKGDKVKSFPLPVVIDRGVFREGQTYQKGSGVTWGGRYWIAQETTTDKPDGGKSWRLAVNKGRDGKDTKKVVA